MPTERSDDSIVRRGTIVCNFHWLVWKKTKNIFRIPSASRSRHNCPLFQPLYASCHSVFHVCHTEAAYSHHLWSLQSRVQLSTTHARMTSACCAIPLLLASARCAQQHVHCPQVYRHWLWSTSYTALWLRRGVQMLHFSISDYAIFTIARSIVQPVPNTVLITADNSWTATILHSYLGQTLYPGRCPALTRHAP